LLSQLSERADISRPIASPLFEASSGCDEEMEVDVRFRGFPMECAFHIESVYMSTTTTDRTADTDRLTPEKDESVPKPHSRFSRIAAFVVQQIPTLLVLASLAGVGVYGHYSHWRLPKFSSLSGAAVSVPADWCEEHGVPESQCVECKPSLMSDVPDYAWCAEHGVHNCPLHHPDVAQLKQTPVVSEADLARAARALATRPRKANNSVCKFHQRRIQFASLEAVRQAGVDVELVDCQLVSESIAANGEITYDQTRVANLSSRAPGVIWQVRKIVGDPVRAGEVLAVVDSMLIGQTKGELVDALVEENLQRINVQRLRELGEGVIAGRQLLAAEADYEKAHVAVQKKQQSLANLGLHVDHEVLSGLPIDDQVERLRRVGLDDLVETAGSLRVANSNLLPIRAPIDGVVVERHVVAGEVVDTSTILFQIADTRQMWLTLSVPVEEASRLAVGQAVRFRPDGNDQEVAGKLAWISTAADSQTRMIKVRADLPNRDGRLLEETFGSGGIILREEPEAIVVPKEAVHWEGCCQIVFVRDKGYFDSTESPKVFHVRTVRTGVQNGKFTEIVAGVLPGEVVATKGSGVLRAQLLKNGLGAGCCVVE
jgi:cobalt-zinc-cadmium efflux system membrane fusion protein